MSVARLERVSGSPLALSLRTGWLRRIRFALIASWRGASLDRELAAGAPPHADALLAVRARRITRRRGRVRVADGLARAMRDARSTGGFSAAVRPDRREVLAARPVLGALDRRLRGPEPVTARGMALLLALLTDGGSPLYLRSEPGALGSQLRAAAAALEPPDRSEETPVARAREEALG